MDVSCEVKQVSICFRVCMYFGMAKYHGAFVEEYHGESGSRSFPGRCYQRWRDGLLQTWAVQRGMDRPAWIDRHRWAMGDV